MPGNRWNGDGFVANLFKQVVDRCLELSVLPVEGGVRQVIDHDVGIDAVAFDQPFAFGSVNSRLRRSGVAAKYRSSRSSFSTPKLTTISTAR